MNRVIGIGLCVLFNPVLHYSNTPLLHSCIIPLLHTPILHSFYVLFGWIGISIRNVDPLFTSLFTEISP